MDFKWPDQVTKIHKAIFGDKSRTQWRKEMLAEIPKVEPKIPEVSSEIKSMVEDAMKDYKPDPEIPVEGGPSKLPVEPEPEPSEIPKSEGGPSKLPDPHVEREGEPLEFRMDEPVGKIENLADGVNPAELRDPMGMSRYHKEVFQEKASTILGKAIRQSEALSKTKAHRVSDKTDLELTPEEIDERLDLIDSIRQFVIEYKDQIRDKLVGYKESEEVSFFESLKEKTNEELRDVRDRIMAICSGTQTDCSKALIGAAAYSAEAFMGQYTDTCIDGFGLLVSTSRHLDEALKLSRCMYARSYNRMIGPGILIATSLSGCYAIAVEWNKIRKEAADLGKRIPTNQELVDTFLRFGESPISTSFIRDPNLVEKALSEPH
jgi:hypothetical protein